MDVPKGSERERELAHLLLVELLAYVLNITNWENIGANILSRHQFAMPVRW